MAEEKTTTGVTYSCVKCGATITLDQLALMPEKKCSYCGYRVLRKVRPPIVKRVKAR